MHIFDKFYIYATYPRKIEKAVLYFTRSLSQKSRSVVPTFFQVTLADQWSAQIWKPPEAHLMLCMLLQKLCKKLFQQEQHWTFPVLEPVNVELGMFEQTLYWKLHCYHPSLPNYSLDNNWFAQVALKMFQDVKTLILTLHQPDQLE